MTESPLREKGRGERGRERMTSHDPFVMQQQWHGPAPDGKRRGNRFRPLAPSIGWSIALPNGRTHSVLIESPEPIGYRDTFETRLKSKCVPVEWSMTLSSESWPFKQQNLLLY